MDDVTIFRGLQRGGAPAYRQIAQLLRDRIAGGTYTSRLPTEDDLMREFSVGRHTVRAAVAKLVDDGLLERFAGRGTFILPAEQRASPWRIRSLEDILDQRFPEPPTIVSAEFQPTIDDPEAAEALQLGKGEQMFRIVALRTAHGLPYSVSKIVLPGDIGRAVSNNLSEQIASTPMIRAVERRCRLQVGRAVQTATAARAADEVADLLKLKRSSPVLVLARTYFSTDGRPIEHAWMFGHPDRYRHTIEFTRHPASS